MDADKNLRRDVALANRIVERFGLSNAFGHVSARIPGTGTFIMPTRRSPGFADENTLITLDTDGKVLSGEGTPNSELWIHERGEQIGEEKTTRLEVGSNLRFAEAVVLDDESRATHPCVRIQESERDQSRCSEAQVNPGRLPDAAVEAESDVAPGRIAGIETRRGNHDPRREDQQDQNEYELHAGLSTRTSARAQARRARWPQRR